MRRQTFLGMTILCLIGSCAGNPATAASQPDDVALRAKPGVESSVKGFDGAGTEQQRTWWHRITDSKLALWLFAGVFILVYHQFLNRLFREPIESVRSSPVSKQSRSSALSASIEYLSEAMAPSHAREQQQNTAVLQILRARAHNNTCLKDESRVRSASILRCPNE